MSAKTSHTMGGSPNKAEDVTAPDTDHRPTRWVMLHGKLRAVKITYAQARALLAKVLPPLMSPQRRRVMQLFSRAPPFTVGS